MSSLSTLRTMAAALVAAAAVLLVPATPASAAASCTGTAGVTVVVDFNQLRGDDLTTGCAPRGGSSAAAIFDAAGYPLTYVSDSDFVCRVSGLPDNTTCARTPPSTAYWGLWWSDGKSGRWVFAQLGATALKVPNGGYVAFAWHQGSGRAAPPDVAPTPRVAPATPKPSVKPKPSAKPSAKPTPKPAATPSASATTASPTATPTPSATASPTAPTTSAAPSATTDAPVPTDPGSSDVPSIDQITDGPPADASHQDDGGGFPVWLGAGLAVVVLGAAAAVPILRRRG